MNEPIDSDKDGNALTLMDTMAVEDDIVDDLDSKMKIEQMKRYLVEELTPREQRILRLRYGLTPGAKPMAQREVAAKMGISRSYVSRIEKKALSNLQKRFREG